ncbi:MAG: OmpA family protein [Bacteroidales bacterium]
MKKQGSLIILLLLSIVSYAQEQKSALTNNEYETKIHPSDTNRTAFDIWVNNDWSFTFSGGSNLFYGDLRIYDVWPAKTYHNERSGALSIMLEKKLTPLWQLRGQFLIGNLSGTKREFESGSPANLYFDARISEYSASAIVNLSNALFTNKKRKSSLYGYVGAGIVSFRSEQKSLITNKRLQSYGYTSNGLSTPTQELVFPVGLIVDYKISPSISFKADASLRIVNTDKLDATISNNDAFFQDMYGYTSIGITYHFGYRDCDNDGVYDKNDYCPSTPRDVYVDEWGCALDTDNDGVPDYLDKCPGQEGPIHTSGCPDTDNDSIADIHDACPEKAGLAMYDGCPDTDNDSIPDNKDDCPEIAGVEKFNGCIDSDGDGIADNLDNCPEKAGVEKHNGCPDTDGDGIIDKNDNCPNVAGIKENNGCPEIKEEVKKVFTQALTGIQFQTGKDVILRSSFPILDQVVKVMNDNPEFKLEINGHTDNVGDDDKNMELSKQRAASVKKYLVSKNIAENRLISKGHGETKPVGDNDTEDGRRKNRRVEFKVLFE